MRKFLIERALPGIDEARSEELRATARKSNLALHALGPGIQWIESYIAEDRLFCLYLSEDEALIRRHAETSGFPADRITEIKAKIDPSTAGD